MSIIHAIHALDDNWLGFPSAFEPDLLRNSKRLRYETRKKKEKEIAVKKVEHSRKGKGKGAGRPATQATRERIPRDSKDKANQLIASMSTSSEDTASEFSDASIYSNEDVDDSPFSNITTSATVSTSQENSPSKGESHLLVDAKFTITFKDGTERTFIVLEVIYSGNGVIGRGPNVYRAKCINERGLPPGAKSWLLWVLIAKFYFPSASRKPETFFVDRARNFAKEHSDEWALNHLPEILAFVDLTNDEEDSVQNRLFKRFGSEEYEKRRLRVSFHEPLEPLMKVTSLLELAQVIYDILQIHQWLYEKPEILHRDISIGNIMFKRDTKGNVLGVLNDFDLASCPGQSDQPSSKHRTGTKPFMAYDLLKSSWLRGHMYRHDLESLFYVLLIICCHYENFKTSISKPPYLKWFTDPVDVVASMKFEFFFDSDESLPIQPFFENFRVWLDQARYQFRQGYSSRPGGGQILLDYVWPTLAGFVSYKNMNRIMCSFQDSPLVRRWNGAGASNN
ncbi:hypothetical protein GYMLUDRAFT_45217 [Collybiopsis luxurians FD-317 M1]|uniref:Protein kinase domain-containing protein n=1 Tax=Collybiopsis luxurians FD-317 M1 TaxID=944289 RepID=A0A0D0CSG9_9AGAR|nr:hypothetical protein GYMLUDRAFT_45217 [Collybiopsis luxurians FD-317 M1]